MMYRGAMDMATGATPCKTPRGTACNVLYVACSPMAAEASVMAVATLRALMVTAGKANSDAL
jgi:hypothetical protein